MGMALLDIFAATVGIFVVCELGQRLSNAFEEILDEFDRFHWYQFPLEISRSLVKILAVSQIPVEMEVFGSITCCRFVMKFVSSTNKMRKPPQSTYYARTNWHHF